MITSRNKKWQLKFAVEPDWKDFLTSINSFLLSVFLFSDFAGTTFAAIIRT